MSGHSGERVSSAAPNVMSALSSEHLESECHAWDADFIFCEPSCHREEHEGRFVVFTGGPKQRLIAIIEGGGLEHAPLDEAEINALLAEAFRNCTRMGAQATALGGRTRQDPSLNLASTLQGLYTEAVVARQQPSHRKFLERINWCVDRFVESNLTATRRTQIEVNVYKLISQMVHQSRSGLAEDGL